MNPAASAFFGRQPRRMRRIARYLSVCLLVTGMFAGLLLSTSPAGAVAGFGDVDDGLYYSEPVQWMVDNNIVTDTTGPCFSPHTPATRGETALYMWRIQNQPQAPPHPFDDVTDDDQHPAVSWMYDTEITTGTSPTTFGPDQQLTRAQLAALLHRLAGEPAASGHPFVDVVAGWQQQPVAWMVANEITTGTSPTTFAPNEPVTRGQLATFLYRYSDSPDVTIDPHSPPCEAFTALDSSNQHSCAIRSNGAVACWGAHFGGQTEPPNGILKAISAGTWHTCGLRTDNTITCWGNNTHLQADAPAGQFTSVSVGSNHVCGLRTNQTITCWGANWNGQTDAPGGQFTSVSAGSNYTCGLRTNQTITCWGTNDVGQTSPTTGRFTSVRAGWSHACALRTDNTITCWGANWYGQTDAPIDQFISVDVGQDHTCGLRTDNTITCWGNNTHLKADAPTGQFTAVSTSWDHSCGLRADATIACWGDDWSTLIIPSSGQFTEISADYKHSCAIRTNKTVTCWGIGNFPNQYDPFGSFKAVSGGWSHACALRTDETITCWGENNYGQTNSPNGQFTAISSGSIHNCALRSDNTITCWGRQTDAPEGQFNSISAGQDHTCALRSDNTVTCWGDNTQHQTDAPEGQFNSISAGQDHTCALRSDNTIACWGANWTGQSNAPDGQFTSISAGRDHTCARRIDSTVTCWGDPRNSQAQAGSFAAVSSGTWHSCGIRENGEISCWSEASRPTPPGVTYVADADSADPAECRPFGLPGSSAGFPLPSGVVRSKGTARVAVLFVDFPNAEATYPTHSEAELGLPYAESYLEASSYGQLDVEFVPLHRWLRAENAFEHYQDPEAHGGGAGPVIYSLAIRLADPEFDFSNIDALMVVLPSSHFHGGTATGFIRTDDGNVARRTMINTFLLDERRDPFRWGDVAAHELIHNLGLLDLYATAGVVDGRSDAPAGKTWITTRFGLMGLGADFPADPEDPNMQTKWVHPDGVQTFSLATRLIAGEMLAWSRWQLEWLDPPQIICVTENEATVTLGPVANPGSDIAMAAIPLSGTEVIVVESRRKIGYDAPFHESFQDGVAASTPSLLTEGVLVYTVDASRPGGHLPLAIATDTGNLQVDRYPLLTDGESVTIRGYTITVQSNNATTHTVTITKNTA